MSRYQIIPKIPTEPQDHSQLVKSMSDYIEHFKNRNIHSENIQQYLNTIEECKKLIKVAKSRCKPTQNQPKLAKWQKDLLELMSKLERALHNALSGALSDALPDALPDKKLTKNTHNTDTTGNPYFVQISNT
jgi:hypothetical protein